MWRPSVGTAVRVTLPDGRILDTTTMSDVFNVPALVAVNGLKTCVALSLVARLFRLTRRLCSTRKQTPHSVSCEPSGRGGRRESRGLLPRHRDL